ncbi:MAG: 50S ribosome-binding GTPase, partial [Planctomycetaceae bacterium]|nr:50S ribosome-binding GTPase [Planctomycetaceae bacterium]
MAFALHDTIAAIASAPGGAVRGIVRLSGPQVLEILARCCRELEPPLASLRQATMLTGSFVLPAIETRLEVNALVWPNTRSYTGQPSVELHLLGSPPLLQAVLDEVCRADCRVALPGEFTLRAVLNGRLDLTQAEAVLGVIHAASDRDLRTALDQLAGGFGSLIRKLRGDLLDALAHLEAGLDFVEEDIEFVTRDELRTQLVIANQTVEQLTRRLDERATTVDLPRVVLIGEPNAGKSSLFNALAGRPQALVSDVAGTTRDYLAATIEMDGVACELVDTAG